MLISFFLFLTALSIVLLLHLKFVTEYQLQEYLACMNSLTIKSVCKEQFVQKFNHQPGKIIVERLQAHEKTIAHAKIQWEFAGFKFRFHYSQRLPFSIPLSE